MNPELTRYLPDHYILQSLLLMNGEIGNDLRSELSSDYDIINKISDLHMIILKCMEITTSIRPIIPYRQAGTC